MIVLNEHSPSIPEKVLRSSLKISLMEKSDIQESANVLSVAMLDAKLHMAVLLGKGERERQEIKKMFIELFTQLPGIVFLAKEKRQIVGVMRMKSCEGFKPVDDPEDPQDENDIGFGDLKAVLVLTIRP